MEGCGELFCVRLATRALRNRVIEHRSGDDRTLTDVPWSNRIKNVRERCHPGARPRYDHLGWVLFQPRHYSAVNIAVHRTQSRVGRRGINGVHDHDEGDIATIFSIG